MRTLKQVEQDITEVSLILENSSKIRPSLDNAGNVAKTKEERIYDYTRRLHHLMSERARLLYVLGREG